VIGMSDLNEDKTLAFHDQTAFDGDKPKSGAGAVIDVPKARLACLDTATIEGALPGEGIIHLIPGSEQTIGRGETCTYPIPSRKLSRQHARIFAGVGTWGIEDLNSTNGVQVNRQKVKTAWLTHGDEVRFGPIPFRFELERPDLAAAASARAVQATPADDGDEERTMMVGSLGAGRAVIEAVRQATPPIEEITPPHRDPLRPEATQSAGHSNRITLLVVVGILMASLAVVGGIYGPAFLESHEIGEVVSASTSVANRVIARARELSGTTVAETNYQIDIEQLSAKEHDIWEKLQTRSSNIELANIYGKIRFLSFERNFSAQFSQKKEDANFRSAMGDAERIAKDLKNQLAAIEHQLPSGLPGGDRVELTTASALSDLASVIVSLHRFGHDYRQVAKSTAERPIATPTLAQLDEAEKRRNEFNLLRRQNIQALSRDYRLFYAIVQDVENKDINLIGRWRELIQQ